MFGAVAGFMTGLLLDTATLGTLGVTSLLLTVGGFWIGRYGETTARDRFHAPYLSRLPSSPVLYAFGQVCSCSSCSASRRRRASSRTACRSRCSLNLLLTLPVYALDPQALPAARAR